MNRNNIIKEQTNIRIREILSLKQANIFKSERPWNNTVDFHIFLLGSRSSFAQEHISKMHVQCILFFCSKTQNHYENNDNILYYACKNCSQSQALLFSRNTILEIDQFISIYTSPLPPKGLLVVFAFGEAKNQNKHKNKI